MHEAYEISHLLNATVQIEAIAAYDNNLLLGTRQGHLLMYSLSQTNGNQKYELQLLRYCKNFSKKPIQQIEVIPEENLLLCLTDNVLSTYNINGVNFPLVKTFEQTKGASLFALDNTKCYTEILRGKLHARDSRCVGSVALRHSDGELVSHRIVTRSYVLPCRNSKILLGNKENVPDTEPCPMQIPMEHTKPSSSRNAKETSFITLQPVEMTPLEHMDANTSINANNIDFTELQTEELFPETLPSDPDDDNTGFEISYCDDEAKRSFQVNGRRIIDLGYFFKSLQQICCHNKAFGCTLSNVHIIAEKRKSLLSKFTLKCDMCNVKFYLDSEPISNLDLNKAATSGIISTGIGFSQFNELFASMDCPSFTQKYYDKVQNKIYDDWRSTAISVMEAAGKRERDAAIAEGRVNKNGIACIDVIADGAWSKRSYNTNFSALSGAAAIIGKRFGEVLFIGVKNKYCCICARASNKNIVVEDHVCYKNYSGSSTGMESNLLLEGFKQSISMHNVIYERMVADGDSSTYKKILEGRPYPDCTVEKVECKNHIFRNMCKKLKGISTETKYPSNLRKKITTQRILAIRKVICSSIKEHISKDADFDSKVNLLFIDITNSYNHAFGNHEHCQPYYCTSQKNSEDLTLTLKTCAIWHRIKFIVNTVASKARSLMHNSDSNKVESFNSIIAKFVGGKRINFSLRRGYESRCDAAVVAFNTKRPLSTLHRSILGISPRAAVKRLEEKRHKQRMRKSTMKGRTLFWNRPEKVTDKNYGENCQKPDMSAADYDRCKEEFLKSLQCSDDERRQIEKKTILQRDSSEWLELRRKLLTASNFGKVINRRPTTSVKNFVKNIIYPKSLSHVPSLKHGIENEGTALEQLEGQLNTKIEPCGLFIDKNLPFLGATPDGVIGEDTIVEIKCPITAFKTSIEDAINKRKINFWKKSKDGLVINKKHAWYLQVQGQLRVTGRRKCIFGPTTSMTGESNSVVRLCVAVRRKLQLYYGKNGEFKQHLFDFTIPDVPKVMSWGQQYVCVGFKAEYVLYDLASGNPQELFPTSSSKSLEPTIAKYSETSFLLGRDQTSVLVEEAKNIDIKKTIKWSEAPIAVVWDEPYVLGLLSDQVIVQTVEPSLFIQTLPELNKARLMYRKVSEIHTSILQSLSDCTPEEKEQKIHSIQVLYALELFDNKQYSQSMKEFIKLKTDPVDVIKLFPELDGKTNDDNPKKLVGKDLENALNALVMYLKELRANIGNSTGQDEATKQRNVTQQLELIDTTLLKCYLQINDALVAPLLRINNCRLEEAERMLLQHGKYSELIILYQTKGQHMKALQLLRDQAKEPDSSLGYQETKNYLQQLGAEHINLIFKFSDWILKEHPEKGLKIFTEDKVEVENLPRPKILDFLLREHESLVIPYLEHVIHTWNDTNSLFHDALINMYRDKITDKKANLTDAEVQHIKAKLVAFLEKSAHYTPERVLVHFPVDSLFEERAIIYGKLGRHEQALAIYVLILGDVDRAIRYCENVSATPNDKNQDVYVILMRILMNPQQDSALKENPLAKVPRHPKTSVPDLETALDILEKHADKISPLKALSVLPDSVPLSRLKHFLESALDGQLTLKRRMQVLKGLLYAEHMQSLPTCPREEKEQRLLSIRRLYALELFDNKQYSQAMKEFIKLKTDLADVIKLIPDLEYKSSDDKEKVKKLSGKDLDSALKAMIVYLKAVQSNLGKDTGQGEAANESRHRELIETTLLKCYLQVNFDVTNLIQISNNICLEQAEKKLLHYKKYSELILLYQKCGQHMKALQLLKDYAKQSDSSLFGYQRTVNYLQQLGVEHINLIFEFSDWILREYPEEGLRIFTEDKVEVENLPRPKILDFLLREHESLVIPYLEHVIHTWNDTNSLFHDALINMYRDKITDKKANLTDAEVQHIKAKLVAFLEKSAHYTPERVLVHFPVDSLFEERAIIYGKLGRHEQALAIYVLILGEVDQAVRYCENSSTNLNNHGQDVYVILLRILINPEKESARDTISKLLANATIHPKTAVPNLERALNILEDHVDEVSSPLGVLSVLPDSVPLCRLKKILENVLESQFALARRLQIVKGLSQAENEQIEDMNQYYESQASLITDGDACPVCKKHFGNQTAPFPLPTKETHENHL
ncbi:hypothetical protein HF086_007339 [Spodoptera exigua]|uniref:CNH domain-containing protein n=1 Tax=Spodoptera exigua TaxID=7107 RepID=A0A922SH98_SPOEX|nr:hypothetical protein HF086_007339 [Spodoptera exigua]